MATAFLPDAITPALIIAHRGLAGPGIRENTLDAYESAFRAGADAVEADLRLGKGGTPVFSHDAELQFGGAPVPIADLDSDECRLHGLPDLNDLAGLLERWPQRGVVIDVKTRAAADTLFSRWSPDPRTMIISFSDHVVVQAVERGWNAAFIEGFLPMILRDFSPGNAYLSPALANVPDYPEQLTDDELRRCVLGVVDDPLRALDLARRGVFAMITSNVRGLRSGLGRDQ